MKKILTVSLFAMMAVSAANADIASTKFVTDRTGDTQFEGSVAQATDLTAAVNALAGKVDTVAGTGQGSVSDQIDSALEDYTNTAGMNSAIDAAKQAAITAAATAAEQYIDADELAASQNTQDTTLKAYADSQATAAKDAAIAAIPAVDATFSADSNNAATSKAIATYVNSVKNELSNGNTTAVNNLQEQIDSLDDDYVSETEIANYTNTAGMNSAIDAAKQAAITAAATAAEQYIDADELAASQNTQDTTLKAYADSQATAAKDAAIAAIPAVDATFSADSNNAATSKAIATYVNSVKNELSNGNTTAVNNLQEQIDSLDDDYVSETEIANYTNTAGMNSAIDAAKQAAITAAKTAGDTAYAAKSYETIVDANEEFRKAIANGTTGSDGTYALTATVSNNTVSGYKWELIGR